MYRLFVNLACVLLPLLSAFAQDPVVVLYSDNTVGYSNFSDAFKAANQVDDASIKLLANISFDGQAPSFSVRKQMTIDLNGYTIGDTLTKANLFEVNADTAVLHLTSSVEGGKIIALRDYKWKIAAIDVKKGRLEVENITIETTNLRSYTDDGKSAGAAPINVAADASLSVNNCVLKSQADYYPYGVSSSSNAESCPEIEVRNTSISSRGKCYVYGVKTFPKTIIAHCNIDLEGDSSFIYAVHISNFTDSINSVTTPTISNTTINVKGNADRIYTIFANSNVNLLSDTINAEGLKSVFGVYCNNSASISKSKVNVISQVKTAYSMYVSKDTANVVVSDCNFSAVAGYTDAQALNVAKGSLIAENSTFDALSRLDTATISTDASTAAVRIYSLQSTANISNCTMIAKAPKPQLAKNIRGLHFRGSGEIESCTIEAVTGWSDCRGISLAATSAAKISDTNIKVYGIEDIKGITGVNDNKLYQSTKAEIVNCNITAEGDINCSAISTYSDLQVADCRLSASARVDNARGINIINQVDSVPGQQHISKIEHVTINLTAAKNAYGVYSTGRLALDSDSILVYADNNSRCVYMTNSAALHNCYLSAESKYQSARTMYVSQDTATIVINNCQLKAESGHAEANAINVDKGSVIAKNSSFEAISRLDTATVLTDAATCALRLPRANTINEILNCRLSARASKPGFSRNVGGLQLGGKADVDSCEIIVSVGSASAMAISLLSTAELKLTNSHLKSNAPKNPYGIYANGNAQNAAAVNIDNCRIEVEGDDNYGISAYSRLSATNSEISALAHRQPARGIVVNNYFDSIQNANVIGEITNLKIDVRGEGSAVGIQSKGVIRLYDDTISVVTDSVASGLYLTGASDINGCEIYVSAVRQKAYGIEQNDTAIISNTTITAISRQQNANAIAPSNSSYTNVYNCKLKTSAVTDDDIIRANSQVIGSFFLHSGFYSNDNYLRLYMPSDSLSVYVLTEGVEYDAGYYYTIRSVANPGIDIAYVYDENQMLKAHFEHLEQALEYVGQHNETQTIVLTGTCILHKGEYHIPRNVTLLVPYMEGQITAVGTAARCITKELKPVEYVRLVLSDSVHVIVDGAIEVSGQQHAGGTLSANTTGYYALMYVPQSSQIELGNNAQLRAWGYVIGEGNIIAKRGARVYENLQIGDWKGGSVTFAMQDDYRRVFPITHYFYQNIECPVTYYSGASALGATSETVNKYLLLGNNISLVGTSNSLFTMKADRDDRIRKQYDKLSDRWIWTIDGEVAINKLDITMETEDFSVAINSEDYVLPIPTNMSIVCHSGSLDFARDVVFLPSSELSVESTANINIPDSVSIYFYGISEYKGYSDKIYYTVGYSPSWTECPRSSILQPAFFSIGGIVNVYGNFYSTESGAHVVGNSSQTQPRVLFHNTSEADYLYQLTGRYEDYYYSADVVESAPLTNDDGVRVQTIEAIAGDEFVYTNGKWKLQHHPSDIEMINNVKSPIQRGKKVVIEDGVMYIELSNGEYITPLGISK